MIILFVIHFLSFLVLSQVNYANRSIQPNSLSRTTIKYSVDGFITSYYKSLSKKYYLIVINHHWDLYDNVVFLRDIVYKEFSKFFPYSFDIINLGPRGNKTTRVLQHGLRRGGWYSYQTLAIAYNYTKNYRLYDGYFLVNDDAIIEPRKIIHYNLSTSLHESTEQYNFNPKWRWTKKRNERNITFSDSFLYTVEIIKNSSYETKCQLSNRNNYRKGFQDFYYVVLKDMDDYCKLSELFYSKRVFLELAAPTINYCLSHQEIITCNHRSWKAFGRCAHYHPIKMNTDKIRSLVMTYIRDNNYTERVPMSY